ncbi:M61 family metallopeptidase [Emticicia sp. BO119]|uniref:M61 family metallopeptidase n=1 Tax=Emticicia sp. BO119 TaxID=2757768 RepID=UPI0015F09E69|nr:M61 family metallopeptidase [Emticicia sp. BO119]MBA4852587.1 M61 family metallopeptidase [Emticicia sp. BO119]
MHYKIYSKDRASHFIDVECIIDNLNGDSVELQLPAWRPGRYELQNFARNIQQFEVFDNTGEQLSAKKITKDRWKVQTNGANNIIVLYNYYAQIINAGSSYVDEHTFYVNPVNLCIYAEGKIKESCTIELQVRENEKIAGINDIRSSTEKNESLLHFIDFYHLADSPFIVSSTLKHDFYKIGKVKFNLWFEGNFTPDFKRIKSDFKKFTQEQINIFGEFPEKEYHFLTWILPVAYYHGVEHRSSTMQVLGPDSQNFEELYIDLLGLASHELFHTWNICKIRPIELLPYDYTRENYFSTCFVAEGVTTYYGDLMLSRSEVFDETQYLKELEVCFKRHFDHADKASQSLVESSWDLWLDGYTASIPDRKVSVYHKGAIAAQILDLHIRKVSIHTRSLDNVMQLMWQQFGKPFKGYTIEDYQAICEEVANEKLDWYFDACIKGNESLFDLLNRYLQLLNLGVIRNEEGIISLVKTTN